MILFRPWQTRNQAVVQTTVKSRVGPIVVNLSDRLVGTKGGVVARASVLRELVLGPQSQNTGILEHLTVSVE